MSSNRRVLAIATIPTAALVAAMGMLAGNAAATTPQPAATVSPSPAGTAASQSPLASSPSPPAPSASAVPTSSASPSPAAAKTGPRRPAPKGCGHIKQRQKGIPSCAYITGFSDVKKLNEAALLQPKRPRKPGLLNVDFGETTKIRHTHKGVEVVARSTARLYYRGKPELPPVRATFLAFRFVPVTATLQITELTPIKILSVSQDFGNFGIKVTSRTKVTLRLSDVTVNGQPLNVGARCRAVTPIPLTLIGRGDLLPRPHGYTIPGGGPLSGTIKIPPFTHCGTTENLDQLFNGTVSGPANFDIMTQGKLCMPGQPPSESVCPPPIPKPKRQS
jgi:hypothetical protein